MSRKDAPEGARLEQSNKIVTNSSRKPKHKTKPELALEMLLNAGQQGVVKFDTWDQYHDTCLNSTISQLKRKHGIEFIKENVSHTHANDGPTWFRRYSIDPNYLNHAKQVLKQLREAREQ